MPDQITLPQIVRKTPAALLGLPKRLFGLVNALNSDEARPGGIALCFEQAVGKNPDGLCLIYQNRAYTYAEFNAWVNRIAHCLSAAGIEKGQTVAIYMENRPELLAAILAVTKFGAVAAMLNYSQRDDVLVHSIKLVTPSAFLVGEERVDAVKAIEKQLDFSESRIFWVADKDSEHQGVATPSDSATKPSKPPRVWHDLLEMAKSYPDRNPVSTGQCLAGEPSFYFFTSGTTGLPKAVIFTNGRYMKAYWGVGVASVQLKAHDRMIISLPFYHATALVACWGAAIAAGAAIVLERKFSASRFWQRVRRHNVTAIAYVGDLCNYLMEQPPSHFDRDNAVRLMMGNGLRSNIWMPFKQRFGIDKVYEFYGSSEGNVGFLNMFNFDKTVGFTPISYAIVQYDVETEEAIRFGNGFMRRVKKGDAGLLIGEIKDSSPFDGYTDPEKTEKSILRNVFKTGDAWFNTGDLMRDLGFRHAQFVDRLGDTFRWKGENVSTTQVENVLTQLRGIAEAVVYGVEIPKTSGRAGMAAIRLQKGHRFEAKKLPSLLREKLPAYAIPIFIRLTQEVETTDTFKLSKVKLKQAGFDPGLIEEKLYVLLPGESTYQVLDGDLFAAIAQGDFRF